jgi:hypothetical protein
VVTFIAVLCAELPAASLAATLKLYVVNGDKPVMVMLGLLVVPAATPFLKTVYPVKEQLTATVEAVQLRFVLLLVVPEACNPVGTLGTVVQALHVPMMVQGAPLPGPPLFVEGFCPCVQKFA